MLPTNIVFRFDFFRFFVIVIIAVILIIVAVFGSHPRLVFLVAAGIFVVVVVGHQLGFDVINNVFQAVQESVEVLFVKEKLVALVSIPVKLSGAFGERQVKVIAFRFADVKEVGSSLTSTDLPRVHTLKSSAVVLVIHFLKI